ncbi:hypothetical protein NPIL_653491 [Nephila pilipes]|uniref:Uncharacterized protein n=1 Tax=Nephila pilipes TaxID=299642 RepID=A0A8X6QWJ8_NEPPI|nr:hypothetical protein NPIL_653491 [Nephila pilipes]
MIGVNFKIGFRSATLVTEESHRPGNKTTHIGERGRQQETYEAIQKGLFSVCVHEVKGLSGPGDAMRSPVGHEAKPGLSREQMALKPKLRPGTEAGDWWTWKED